MQTLSSSSASPLERHTYTLFTVSLLRPISNFTLQATRSDQLVLLVVNFSGTNWNATRKIVEGDASLNMNGPRPKRLSESQQSSRSSTIRSLRSSREYDVASALIGDPFSQAHQPVGSGGAESIQCYNC
jgi:hypothetical protein